MTIKSLFILFFCLSATGASWSQQLSPAQQAELEHLSREAQAELTKALDPGHMARLFDEQIQEARKSGTTPAQIKALESAKTDALRQLRANRQEAARQNTQADSEPAPTDTPDKAGVNSVGALKNRLTHPVPVIYDEQEGRYSHIPRAFRVYAEAKLTPEKWVAFMHQQYGVTLREKGRFGTKQTPVLQYEQLHKSYVVRLARYSITLDSTGYVNRASGTLFALTAPDPGPATTQTLLLALRRATQQPTLPLLTDPLPSQRPPAYAQAEAPMWVPTNLEPTAKQTVLTRPFTVTTPGQVVRWYLDAQTGRVVASENRLFDCTPPAPRKAVRRMVSTFHSGRKAVTLEPVYYNNKPSFYLADSSETPAVVVLSPENETSAQHTDTSLTDAKLRVRGDFDALYGLRRAATYFKTMGINSFDDAGTTIRATAFDRVNASYSPSTKQFYFGMYEGKPLLTLLVAGHEFTHGVSDHYTDFVARGEPGALHESIADMLGRAIEQQVMGGNWVILDEVVPNGLRSMSDPKTLKHPDTYGETFWANPGNLKVDEGGVHINAGIGNRWFYLLVNGGKGQNDLKHSYDIQTTIPIHELTKLVLTTLPKLGPTSGYDDFCRETIATAEGQYGECSKRTHTIKQAWYAVGVLDDPPVPCSGWSFDMVASNGTEQQVTRFYFRGDSAVAVTRTPDGILKSFARRSSPTMTAVVQNTDGVNVTELPKSITPVVKQAVEETLPALEVAMSAELEKARTERNTLGTSPERRATLDKGIPVMEKFLRDLKQGRAEAQKTLDTLQQGEVPVSAMTFWETRQVRRNFDKQHIKAYQKYENKYEASKYVMQNGIYWWSTTRIPLRMSDLMIMIPYSPVTQMRNGLDHWLRGFPLDYLGMFKIKNIREHVPVNFDALFSTAPVFQ
ncbi:M4 family metallopeptidase [Spirosoma sp. 209]|uniref:M4 family metallopeptidase n=1 Tax=Spirosoma sp. 209 TaxID=1955701 RepID=UPI00098D6511|nr:M4 family metallopeptidase [Spirosoma sp. 209]